MPNSKRKQEVIKVDLNGQSPAEIEKLCEQIEAEMQKAHGDLRILPREAAFSDTKRAILKPGEVEDGALWYFWRMPTWYDDELWWGWTGWEAFGWWEGENPFKDWWNGEGKYWHDADIAYVKKLNGKGERDICSQPQGKRAFFIVKDLTQALDALEKVATTFVLSYEDGVVKLLAWNKEKPDFKACLMVKYDWKRWCRSYYEHYTDFGWKLLEWSYGINTPDPVWKDGKLVFGDEFSKTPEEFIYDLATLEPPCE